MTNATNLPHQMSFWGPIPLAAYHYPQAKKSSVRSPKGLVELTRKEKE